MKIPNLISTLFLLLFLTALTHCLVPEQKVLKSALHQSINTVDYKFLYGSLSELLSRENWLRVVRSPTKSVSPKCIESFRRFNTSIPGRPMDILYLFDSFSKPQPGLLTGNLQWVGNWDECMALSKTRFVTLTIPISTQPSNSRLSADPFPTTPTVSFDICIPIECDNASEIRALLESIGVEMYINTSAIGIYSHVPIEITAGRVATLVLLSIFALLILISTLVEFVQRALLGLDKLFREDYLSASQLPSYGFHIGNTTDTKFNSVNEVIGTNLEGDLTKPADPNEYSKLLRSETYSRSMGNRASTIIHRIIEPFSLYTNVRKVFDTYQPPNAIRCLNGIRTLSMFWVILGHCYLFGLFEMTNTLYLFQEVALRFSFQPVLNGYFSVDSFFVLSGILVMYLSLRELCRTKKTAKGYALFLLKFYVHRVLRITPTLFVVLVSYWQLTPLLSDGPLWRPSIDGMVELCDGTGWISPLFYFNNFYPKFTDGCMAWTWYLANDMQFFIISPIFIFLAYFLPFPQPLIPLGITVCLFLFPSFILTAVFSLHSNFYFPINHLSDGLLANASSMPQGDLTEYYYTKPYCRINPYLIGMGLGYILWKISQWKRESENTRLLELRMAVLDVFFWPISFVICFALVYGLYGTFHGHIMSEFENILYLGLSRTLWGLGLSLFIFICFSGMGGPIDAFLSWGVFVPLSRLTFSAYLIHPVVIAVFMFSLRDKLYYYDITYAFLIVGLVAMSYVAAAIIAICIEFPLSNVEDLILRRKKKQRKPV